MRLVELELKNIRSYKKEKVVFPNGLVLLSGDIGCGKSTILLAIEFALFGLRRGEITGSSLLRHGSNDGYVKLAFLINNKEYVVKRTLKRTATSVSQGPGTLKQDGVTSDLTAVELRAKVLELLNYPESLLSQTKSLVFRYTVYTPQEQMKHILFEKPEERLDTMRKLFSIDKYKRIRENAALVSKELRSSIERLRGQGDDLAEIKQQQEQQQKQLRDLTEKEELLQKELEQKSSLLEQEKKRHEALERTAKEYEEKKRLHAVTHEQLIAAKNSLQQTRQEIYALSTKEYDEGALEKQRRELQKAVAENEAKQQSLKQNIDENNKNGARLDAKKEQVHEHQSITEIQECPTCKQEVGEEYKASIREKTENSLRIIAERQALIKQTQERLNIQLTELQAQHKQLMNETQLLQQEFARMEANKKNIELKKKKQEQETTLTKKIFELETKEKILLEQVTGYNTKELEQQRAKTRAADEVYQQARLQLARQKEQVKSLRQQQETITKSIVQKEAAQLKAAALNKQQEWLTKHFSNLMYTIEKNVLMTLYHNFNDAFKEWFDALIEDDTISVRLDHDFSPLVEQNGYETLIENLSGGEKTSVALAYRLALNNVINQALHELQTDGVLILDEPTDGFSTEQLDRVQEVLSKLSLEQILIVSHEPKMESFMDHVIRISKNEHESAVH